MAERHLHKAAEQARGKRPRTAIHADDNRVRAVARRNVEFRCDRHRLAAFLDGDREGAAAVGGAHVGRNRLVADFVLFDIGLDFVTAFAPVAILGDLGAVVEFEWVGEFSIALKFARLGAKILAAVFGVEIKRYFCKYHRT